MKRHFLIPLACLFALPGWTAPYVSLGVGVLIPSHDDTIKGNSTYDLYNPTSITSSIFQLPDMRWKNEYQVGADTSFSVGQTLPANFRLEGEFVYQYMPRETSGTYGWEERYSSTGALFASQYGNPFNHEEVGANVYALLANLFYDFKNNTAWTPFIGAGIGVAWLDSSSETSDNELNIEQTSPPLSEYATTAETIPTLYGTAFAWQVKLGLNYAWTEHLTFDAVYRLLGTSHFEQKDGAVVTNPRNPAYAAVFSLPQSDIDGLLNNSIDLAFRYQF